MFVVHLLLLLLLSIVSPVVSQVAVQQAWWDTIKQSYNGEHALKMCPKRQSPPIHDSRCGPRNKTCFWGNQPCEGFGAYPATTCSCIAMKWTCADVACPTSGGLATEGASTSDALTTENASVTPDEEPSEFDALTIEEASGAPAKEASEFDGFLAGASLDPPEGATEYNGPATTDGNDCALFEITTNPSACPAANPLADPSGSVTCDFGALDGETCHYGGESW